MTCRPDKSNTMLNQEAIYTLVDDQNRPVYTDDGMDGHFALCSSLADMMTFSKAVGWSQMMHLVEWSHAHTENGRIKVYPVKVNMIFEKVNINE